MFKHAYKTSLGLALALLSLPIAVAHAQAPGDSPFLAKVRQATTAYRNINVAARAGWFGRDAFCVSGPPAAAGCHRPSEHLFRGHLRQSHLPQCRKSLRRCARK